MREDQTLKRDITEIARREQLLQPRGDDSGIRKRLTRCRDVSQQRGWAVQIKLAGLFQGLFDVLEQEVVTGDESVVDAVLGQRRSGRNALRGGVDGSDAQVGNVPGLEGNE